MGRKSTQTHSRYMFLPSSTGPPVSQTGWDPPARHGKRPGLWTSCSFPTPPDCACSAAVLNIPIAPKKRSAHKDELSVGVICMKLSMIHRGGVIENAAITAEECIEVFCRALSYAGISCQEGDEGTGESSDRRQSSTRSQGR